MCLKRLWVWLFMRWSRYIYCDRLWWADFAWRLATWRTGRQSWDDAWFRLATSYKSSGWFCLYAFICFHLVQGHVTARALQPPTNQPTGHQMSWQGLYMHKKAYFGAKMAVFLAKRPNYVGREQKFWYPQSKNHWRTLFALFYWLGMAPNGPCRPICGQIDDNCIFWAKNS